MPLFDSVTNYQLIYMITSLIKASGPFSGAELVLTQLPNLKAFWKMDLFFFPFWSKEAAESLWGLSTRLGYLAFAEGLTDDSIVQPRPKEEEKLYALTKNVYLKFQPQEI